MLRTISSLLILFLGFSVSAQNKKSATASKKPNIIYILADDLGIGELSCYGADNYSTPHIDALAKTGMQLKNGYTAPLCGPSRALILTGRYAFRTGATNQDRCMLIKPSGETMMPTVLKKAGYTSSMIGKWGQFDLTPADFGFDDYIKFKGSGVYWSGEKKKAEVYTVNGVDKPLRANEYMPELMHDHLVGFLSDHKNKPFYVYYSLAHVHAKIQATPLSKPGTTDYYPDNINYMDLLVGKLVATLDSLKLRENTLIVFMGDNGTASQYAARGTIGGRQLSGKKGSMLECGSLVPMIANWPGVIAENTVSNTLIDATDLMPTFAEVAGAKLPAGTILDGRSFLPQLSGKKGNPREWIFMELGNKWYVRDANWKLNREGELFDMRNAPFEEKLVADHDRDKVAAAAFRRLQLVLNDLAPEKGILDDGAGNGRHASNNEKNKKAQETEE